MTFFERSFNLRIYSLCCIFFLVYGCSSNLETEKEQTPIAQNNKLVGATLDSTKRKDSTSITLVKSNNTTDSSSAEESTSITPIYKVGSYDSTHQRILLMGDSEAGGLMYPLNDYCKANGHELVATYVWNSSTILNYAYSKKVEELLNKYRPTMVLFVVGLNELYAKDLKKRTKAAQKFIEKLGDVNYLWVGPANFDKDNGINAVFEATAAKGKFFRSKDISIPKGSDKRHPSISGYRIWMTSIANHIQNDTSYGFTLNPPKKRGTIIKGKVITANAAKDRGY